MRPDTIPTKTAFYVTGGTVSHEAPSYVERQADTELRDALDHGEFCYVLTSRQMGKSSLMARTAARLRAEGVAVAVLDLTSVGQNLTAEQWYDGLLTHVGYQLHLEDELEAYWLEHERLGPLQRWMGAIRNVVLVRCPGRVVVFIDEIDTVRSLPFSTDEFFAAIRECFNRRPHDPEFHRLTFCLLGVATPSDLIQDTRTTPFNIGRRIDLTDFTEAESAPLRAGLVLGRADTSGRSDAEARTLLKRILYWTGGHPYLTQRLCRAVAEDTKVQSPAGVDRHCEELFLSSAAQERDDNLLFVRERLLKNEADVASVLDLYARVRAGRRGRVLQAVAESGWGTIPAVELENAGPLLDLLRLSGIARQAGNRLVVRNRIYARVFNREWVAEHMPDAEVRRQRAAYRRGVVRATAVSGAVLAVVGALAMAAVQSESRARRASEGRQVALVAVRTERDNAVHAGERERAQRVVAQRAEKWASQSAKAAGEAARKAEENAGIARRQEYLARSAGEKERQAARHARDLAAREQLDRGVRLMEQGESVGLLDVLQAHQTAVDIPEVRQAAASAWNGWAVAVEGRLARVVGHRDAVRALALSPDGRLMVTGSADHTARLWQTASGEPQGAPLHHQGDVVSVAFSPDGKLVATASLDHTARLWQTATGKPHGPPLRHADTVEKVAFSPDGKLLATGSRDDSARLWDTATGKPHGLPLRHADYIMSLAFSPNGKLLATASWDSAARLWDTATGKPFGPEMRHVAPVREVAFSPDGKLLATASNDMRAVLWETATGRPHGKAMGHAYAVAALAFSPDGKLLATGSMDAGVRLWDTATGEPHGPVMLHEGAVASVAFSPDGEWLASGSADWTARLWEVRTGKPHGRPLHHQSAVGAIAFSPDGELLTTCSLDGTARLWSMQPLVDEEPLPNRRLPHPEIVWGGAFSPDGKLTATACLDDAARLWETATGKPYGRPLRHLNGVGPSGVNRVVFSADGKRVATAALDRTARLWDVATGRQCGPPLRHQSWVGDVVFSRDGKLLATASNDRKVRLWDVATGKQRGLALSHPQGAGRLAITPDGKRLASGTLGAVRLWEFATGKSLGTLLRCPGFVQALAFSPDGKRVATGHPDGTARLWETATGRSLGPPLRQKRRVEDVTFSPDGQLLATAAREEGARIWEIGTGKACGPPLDPDVIVEAVAFSPDGKLLLTGSRQNQPKLWRLPTPASSRREMELRTWVALGARLNARGDVEALRWEEWCRLRDELATLQRRQTNRAGTRIGDPTAPPWVAWSNRGDAFHVRGQQNQAVAAFTRAIQRGADDWWVWYRRGQAHAALKEWEKADADWARALRLGAYLQHVWRDEALVQLQRGDTEGYRKTCTSAIDRFVKEGDYVTLAMLGLTCDAGALPAADLRRVIALAETWVAREPRNAFWLHILGALLYRTGRYEEALQRLNQSLAAASGGVRADIWITLAMCHYRLGHVTEARQLLDKASQMIDAARPMAYIFELKYEPMLHEAEALIRGPR